MTLENFTASKSTRRFWLVNRPRFNSASTSTDLHGFLYFARQAHKEIAGQDLQALRALLDLAVPLDVQDIPESVGLLDLPDTATLLSVSVFLTTGKDT